MILQRCVPIQRKGAPLRGRALNMLLAAPYAGIIRIRSKGLLSKSISAAALPQSGTPARSIIPQTAGCVKGQISTVRFAHNPH